MGEYLLISDAAKQVKVESHVLRYWEEELHLPIKRNELGHRYYTKEDVERFKEIKSMKERGLQLKAIKMILKDGKLDVLPEETTEKEAAAAPRMAIEIVDETVKKTVPSPVQETSLTGENREEKVKRLQWILQQMIREAVRENNQELCRELKESRSKNWIISSAAEKSVRKSGIAGWNSAAKNIIRRWTSCYGKRPKDGCKNSQKIHP